MYLEDKGKIVREEKQKMAAKFSVSEKEKQKGKGKAKTASTMQQEKPEKSEEVCSHCKYKGHSDKQC